MLEHDFMMCNDDGCATCEEAESQSLCDECGGPVISADGIWIHEPGCSKATETNV